MGRLQFVYDQDKNIISKRTFVKHNTIAAGLQPVSFTYSPGSNIETYKSITFTTEGTYAPGEKAPGIVYTWNYGDGTAPVTGTSKTQSHAYTATGNYTVTLTASQEVFGTVSTSQAVAVSVQAPPVTICQSGVRVFQPPSTVVETITCAPNPYDVTHTYFTVNSVYLPAAQTVATYQWQIFYDDGGANSGIWINTGTNSNRLTMNVNSSSRQYFARCIVTTSGGTIYTSDALGFYIGGVN